MVPNNEGGFVFSLDNWGRLDRFLILGSDAPTYYAGAKALTIENAKCVEACIKADGARVVRTIVDVSDRGRAPKNDPALFALALCCAADDVKTRQAALAALPKIARIGTHLFHFAAYVNAQRGWGRALRRAIANWYMNRSADSLAVQLVKFQQRDGWSHRDLLRLSHPRVIDAPRRAAIAWATHGEAWCGEVADITIRTAGKKGKDGVIVAPQTVPAAELTVAPLPDFIAAYNVLRAEPTASNAVKLIRTHGLPREAIPTALLNDVAVWDALLEDMPMTALIRNLGKMSAIGLLKPLSEAGKHAAAKLTDIGALKKARIHPFNVLLALRTYAQGHGELGKLSWTAVPQIVDALDTAFYLSFEAVEPTGKRFLMGIDVSGSMSSSLMGSPLEVNEGAAALAMTVARTEANYHVCAFDHGMQPITITAKSTLAQVLKQTKDINGGGTDCSLPMQEALRQGWEVDAFVVITDNETHHGRMHPLQALEKYREKTGIPAKLIVVGMTSTGFTIADPKDSGMLDIVGWDSAAPTVMASFVRG